VSASGGDVRKVLVVIVQPELEHGGERRRCSVGGCKEKRKENGVSESARANKKKSEKKDGVSERTVLVRESACERVSKRKRTALARVRAKAS
jgi:hypothetical protein